MSLRLILLGTDGGPRPKVNRSAPANLVVFNDELFVVDCGNGVARQIVRAGYDLHKLRATFITHNHSDHNADYGTLLLLAWASGLSSPVDTYGPAPISDMTSHFVAMNKFDIDLRESDEGRPNFQSLVTSHEVASPGVIYERGGLQVSCVLVNHPPIVHSFAYRFDTFDRSIVFSGDTTYCPDLVEFARGADVLVHEVMFVDALEDVLPNNNGRTLLDHLLSSHTPVGLAGKVAEEAQVKTLVLSHFVPGSSIVSDDQWKDAAEKEFSGEVIVGHDLMNI